MAWSLSDKERTDTAARIAANISTLAFFKGDEISDAAAASTATAIEKKAYTASLVAARTTTGNRPAAEITSGYVRCALCAVLCLWVRWMGVVGRSGCGLRLQAVLVLTEMPPPHALTRQEACRAGARGSEAGGCCC